MKNLYYNGWMYCSFKETEVKGRSILNHLINDVSISIFEINDMYLLYVEYPNNVSMPVGIKISKDIAKKFMNLKEDKIKDYVNQIMPFLINL